MQMQKLALVVLMAAGLAACSSTKLEEPAPVVPREEPKIAAPVQDTKPTETGVKTVDLDKQLLDAANAKGRTVYFDFDSFVVKSDFQNVIDAHAKRMSVDTKVALRLEGHTDERGGSEYNLALGQKRAEAVAKSLSLLGVPAARVEPVSFGKERPAVQGSDEAAWAKNRRVELKDK